MGFLPSPRRVSGESITGWAYAAAASATVLILAGATAADADTLHLLYGNVLAVSPSHATGLVVLALVIGIVHVLFGSRFLLVTFDAEAAQVAGVNTRLWSICLNLSIGAAAAAAVHEIGALLTFSLLTLAPMASLLVTRRIRTTFVVSAAIGIAAVCARPRRRVSSGLAAGTSLGRTPRTRGRHRGDRQPLAGLMRRCADALQPKETAPTLVRRTRRRQAGLRQIPETRRLSQVCPESIDSAFQSRR